LGCLLQAGWIGCIITGEGKYGRDGSVSGSGCQQTADCDEGHYCTYARDCHPGGTTSEGDQCDTTANCQAGLVCAIEGLTSVCVTPGTSAIGEACSTSADCQAGLFCPTSQDAAATCVSPVPSDDVEPPPSLPLWGGATCPPDDENAVAYFVVPREDSDTDYFRLPFPNDIHRTATGALDLTNYPNPGSSMATGLVDRYLQALEENVDGFSRSPVVAFRFSKPADYDTVQDAITLINITPGSDDYDDKVGFSWFATHGRTTKYICSHWLAVRPNRGRPLRAGETYAVVLATTVTDSEGGSFQRSPDLETMLSSSAPSDQVMSRAYAAYGPLREWLADTSTDPNAILNAAVFTVQSDGQIIPKLRRAIRGADAPQVSDLTLCSEGTPSPCNDGTTDDDARRCGAANDHYYELHGRLSLPIFQQGTAPYYDIDDGGAIAFTQSGEAVAIRQEEVCIGLTIPKVPTPTEGFPLVIYGHGTNGSFRGAMGNLATDLATGRLNDNDLPVATLALDLPQHGARRADSTQNPDVLFFNFANPAAAHGNVAQGAADLMSLLYWAETATLAADHTLLDQEVSFDDTRLALFGHSQGATHASLILPFETQLIAAILSGVGGHLTNSLLEKTNPIDIAGILPYALMDPNTDGQLATGASHPALAIFQTYFDSVDPVNYGRQLFESTTGESGLHLFMTYGLGDTYTPEVTQQAYAYAAGLYLVEPVLTTNSQGQPDPFGLTTSPAPLGATRPSPGQVWTHGVRQYQPDGDDDGHFVSTRTDYGRTETVRFLLQALGGETPEIGQAGDRP
jgi:hypothetical protein